MEPLLRVENSSKEELLDQRLGLYFRSLGLRDESAIRQAVLQIRARLAQNPPADATVDFVRAGMTEATSAVESWIEQLRAACATRPGGAGDAPDRSLPEFGVLMWRLRALLNVHPELLFSLNGGTEALQVAVRLAEPPILPPESHVDMPAQPLGDVPEILSPTFWKRLRGRWSRVRASLAQLITREREQV